MKNVRRILFVFIFLLSSAAAFNSCRETPEDKAEDAIEEVEDAAEDAADEAEDAAEEAGEAVEESVEEIED